MAKPKHEPGPPMDLANMREQGVTHLIAYCLNDLCRHQAVIDMSSYPGNTRVPWFKLKCSKCGRGGHWVRRAAALERCEPGYRLARHRRHACWWRVMPRAGAFPDNGAHVAWVRR